MSQQALETLVAEARQSATAEAYDHLFTALPNEELFFNAVRNDDGTLTTPLVQAGNNQKAVLFFTSRDHKNLQAPFAGIPWRAALEMVLAGSSDGLVVRNLAGDWVAIDKTQVVRRLQALDAAPRNPGA